MVETRLASKGGRALSCVGDVCVTEQGELEIHIDGSDPKCAALTQILAEKVLRGEMTHYVIDPPKDVQHGAGKAPAKARKA